MKFQILGQIGNCFSVLIWHGITSSKTKINNDKGKACLECKWNFQCCCLPSYSMLLYFSHIYT